MFLPSMAKAEKTSINGKMNIALIGVGGIGSLTISTLKKCPEARISALCDVDDTRIAGGAKEYPNAPKFRDFRRMLDKMDKEIDGVAISTPDHMHFPIAAWALKAGKHVFCQKPLVRTVWEARKLREIASKSGLITQMGNQGHTNDGWRVIKEWYDAGIIGKIEEIHCWTNRPVWPQGFSKRPPEEAVPASLDYKLWLGVAPQAPYSPRSTHFNWRGYRDYGTGAGGDMACHILDASYSAFELGLPYRISGEATEYTDISWPKQTTAHLEFRNPRGVKGKIMLNWYDGGRKPKNVKKGRPELYRRSQNLQRHADSRDKRNSFHNRIRRQSHNIPARKNGGDEAFRRVARPFGAPFKISVESSGGMGKGLLRQQTAPGKL